MIRHKHVNPYRLGFLGVVVLVGLITAVTHVRHIAAADSTWTAKYWDNPTLSGTPVLQRQENDIDHDWGDAAPHTLVPDDNFSARWTRSINFAAGNYRFTATMDDGMRVWVDSVLIIDSWWDSQVHSQSGDVYLTAGDHTVKVEYYEVGGGAIAKLTWAAIGGTTPTPTTGWQGQYYNNTTFSGTPVVVRTDQSIDFDWGSSSPVASTIPTDGFSVRWTCSLTFNQGRYQFIVNADDGVRLWVNGRLLIDQWHDATGNAYSADIDLPGGSVPIQLEYYENQGTAMAHLTWQQLSGSTTPTPVPGSNSGTIVSAQLNVRSGPGVDYTIISQLTQGQAVTFAGYRSADANWVMINWNGSTAWISAKPAYLQSNITISSLPVWSGSTTVTGSGTATVVNASYLNVRQGPAATYEVVTVISSGTTVTLLGRNSASTWAKIQLG
ncbi:MAG: SH3 domain-containing protein, partial [Anaerolineales bacterium]|nr:SH3 domain-containing protein [Anaerolineales bacterium]